MSKQVVIDVPDWVDDSLAEKLKKMLIAKIREEIERDYTDMKLYNLYYKKFYGRVLIIEREDNKGAV